MARMTTDRAVEVATFVAGLRQTGAGSVVVVLLEVERELWDERTRFEKLLRASRKLAALVPCTLEECGVDKPTGMVVCPGCQAKEELEEVQKLSGVRVARQTPDGSFGAAQGGPSLDLPVGGELVDEDAPYEGGT